MKRKNSTDLYPLFFVMGAFPVCFVGYIIYRWQIADNHLISFGMAALFAGVVYESRRLSGSWSAIFKMFIVSLCLSLLIFLPFKREAVYVLENHITPWPYCFIICFIIYSVIFHEEKVIPQLTEGVTLLQSIAVIYWAIDLHLYENPGVLVIIPMAIGVLFALFTIFNAFTHVKITELSRLILSLWSSIIMLLFSADYIFRVFDSGEIELAESWQVGFYIALQYFLLGVSGIYMAHNLWMLVGLLPGKNRGWRDIADILERHVKRYSDIQVNIWHSLFCVLITGVIFWANYQYHLLPRHVAIWLVFTIFPLLLYAIDYLTKKPSELSASTK